MSTGHNHDATDELLQNGIPDGFLEKFFALPFDHKPGEHFRYDSTTSHLLSIILQKVTGQNIQDYLQPRLFEPLSIATPRWEKSVEGITEGCFGLQLRTEDLAKFGQFYLQKGRWGEHQIVPAQWVAEATAKQMDSRKNATASSDDWQQGYGYQFWRCRYGFYRADGARGQMCIVMEQYDAVLIVTAETRNISQIMDEAWRLIVPALGHEANSPPRG
jgi:CubicO group peptidase (beta-lactamase class C family)